MITDETNNLSPGYSTPGYSEWFGKSVVVLIAFRQCQVPMPCSIVAESMSDVRVRVTPGWELNLPKQLILAVEEDAAGLSVQSEPTQLIN
jgi:hypothetical protein